MVRPTSCTICGARPSDGSSISSTRGLPIRARPIASICCSPPESEPASCAWRSFSRGNSANTRSSDHDAAGARLRRHHQVLAHGERAEHAAALRHQADALAGDGLGREPRDRLAEQRDRAAARPQKPHDGRHAGGLAGAVAAEQAEQAAGLQREADAVQHMAVAVIGVDVADAQRLTRQGTPPWCADRRPPRRACLRRSPRRSAAA